MKKLNIRFEQDPALEDIDVVIRASEKDPDIDLLIAQNEE